MDENKAVDTILILVFILGIVGLGLFFFSGNKYPSEDPNSHFTQERLRPNPSNDIPKEDFPISKPVTKENKQIETTTELRDPSKPNGIDPVEKTSDVKEVIPVLETDLPEEENLTFSQNTEEKSLVKEKEELRFPNKKITVETKNFNGAIAKAQEIPEGTVSGKKTDVNDRADFFKIRAKGEKMSLILEPALKTINDRSVMTIYNSQLKIIGEYFSYSSTGKSYKVTKGGICYIKLNLSSTEKPSFDYSLKVEFQNASLN